MASRTSSDVESQSSPILSEMVEGSSTGHGGRCWKKVTLHKLFVLFCFLIWEVPVCVLFNKLDYKGSSTIKFRIRRGSYKELAVVFGLASYMVLVGLASLENNWRLTLKHGHGRPSEAKKAGGPYRKLARAPLLGGLTSTPLWGLASRSGLVLSWWLALNVTVPMLESLTLLGLPLWRWSLLAFAFPVAYIEALCFSQMLSTFPLTILGLGSNWGLYGDALMTILSLVLYFGLLLTAWLLYFGTEQGVVKHPDSPITQYVTLTCVTLLVGSILWFFKSLLLLYWTANAVYRRFEKRLKITGVKFVFLGAIAGDFFESPILRRMRLVKEYKRLHTHQPDPADAGSNVDINLHNYIMSAGISLASLQFIAQSLTSLAEIVTGMEKDGIPALLKFFPEGASDMCQPDDLLILLSSRDLIEPNPGFDRTVRKLIVFLRNFHRNDEDVEDLSPNEYRKNSANVLHCLVREECASTETDQFSSDDFKKWMVDAHMNCVNMGRTIADANAIVTHLDIFISSVILFAVALLWLLITGVATTKVLVTISAPIFALTFIFGDTAKTFFQGIIFCFVTHAFDVGDRCVVDDIELEVKKIGILTTTFTKIGTEERRLYPNSVLATKAIVNLGWKPDPLDTVELTLDLSTSLTSWKTLEEKIAEFFGDPGQRAFFESSYDLMMKESSDKIKMTIKFKHVLNVNEMTHGQCIEKKNRQRHIILKKVSHSLQESLATKSEDESRFVNSQVVSQNHLNERSSSSEIEEH